MTENRYDVVIVETKTRVIHAVIGRNMPKDSAERRIRTGLINLDRDRFFVADIPHDKNRNDGDVI